MRHNLSNYGTIYYFLDYFYYHFRGTSMIFMFETTPIVFLFCLENISSSIKNMYFL